MRSDPGLTVGRFCVAISIDLGNPSIFAFSLVGREICWHRRRCRSRQKMSFFGACPFVVCSLCHDHLTYLACQRLYGVVGDEVGC